MSHFRIVKRIDLDPNAEPDEVDKIIREAKNNNCLLHIELRKPA